MTAEEQNKPTARAADSDKIAAEVREIKREIGCLRRSTRTTNERLDQLLRRLEKLTTGHAS